MKKRILKSLAFFCYIVMAQTQFVIAEEYEAVDLGLSVKWATCNIGATSPEQYGNYYAWGELDPKNNYDCTTYKYCSGYITEMTKYVAAGDYLTNYNKVNLKEEDDVAIQRWGGEWRMPTLSEFEELQTKCKWEWITFNGVKGYKVSSMQLNNTNFIFLPIAGYYYGTNKVYDNTGGEYWSSTLYDKNGASNGAASLYFSSTMNIIQSITRPSGLTVRPVMDAKKKWNITAQPENRSIKEDLVLGGGMYFDGDEATLTVISENNNYFTSWSDGNSENPRKILVSRDSTFYAIFSNTGTQDNVKCTVVNESSYGTVSFTGTVIKDSNISLKATAPECSQFVKWSDDDTSNPRTLTVTQDSTLTAIFEKIQFNITLDADEEKGKVVEEK